MLDNTESRIAVDVESLRKTAALFLTEGGVAELRLICGRRLVQNGYYNSADDLVRDAARLTGPAVKGVYLTLNPVKPELLNRRPNSLAPAAKGESVSDADIVSRRWMLIDCDPERHADTNATESEKCKAQSLATCIRDQLLAQDWPEPVIADSGNGWHLLYQVDLPSNDEGLVKACLEWLSKLSGDGVKVDVTVANPSRITKFYGSITRKGPHSEDRPHRVSRLVETPSRIDVVPKRLMEEMVGRVRSSQTGDQLANRARAYLAKVSPSISGQGGHDAALTAACHLIRGFGLSIDEARPLMREFNQRCLPPWGDHEIEHKLESAVALAAQEPGRIGEKVRAKPVAVAAASQLNSEPSLSSADGRTEVANSRRFLAQHGEKVRYCHAWKQWLVWDGARWAIDNDGAMSRLGKSVTDALWREVPTTDMSAKILAFVKSSCSETGIRNMLALAASEVAISPDEMDTNPWLLNCPNGTVDLRTGQLRGHRREDCLTKLCPTAFDPSASSVSWEHFLQSVFPDDGIAEFVQRFFGYSLTGDVREQLVAIFHGGGSNGKSTLLTAIQNVLGSEYSAAAPEALLMAKKFDSHPTDKATLFGRRLIVAQETDRGRKLDEATVKRLTGGDRISARRMKEDFWDFSPTHKIVQSTNYLPIITGDDHAMWRRLALVPFRQQFWNADNGETGPEMLRQDKQLPDKLRAESEGILAWMVRGCLEWRARGIQIPDKVQFATREYRQEQDVLGRFVDERCAKVGSASVKFADLYRSLVMWGEETGEDIPDKKSTGQWLDKQGFTTKRGAKGGATATRNRPRAGDR
ncbi:MAG: hypothetical protein JWP89_5197 [Schlesneria sp.]|nr:hypothetical protein [Schlesneria sp.]